MAKTILSLHGFASSARSTKNRYLEEKLQAYPDVAFHALDFSPTPADFEYMTTTGLINRARQYVLDHHLGPLDIVGSSFGGLIAVHYAHRFGGVDKMLLLAPGLRWLSGGMSEARLAGFREAGVATVPHYAFDRELPLRYDIHQDGLGYLDPIAPACPVTIIHGNRDTTAPFEDSRRWATEHPEQVQLIEVDADHDLNGHIELIWEHVQRFLLQD